MHWNHALDMPAIADEVCAKIEGGKLTTKNWTRWIEGKWRGRSIKIVCWHEQRSTATAGWTVDVDAGGPPLTLRVCQKILGEGALTKRDLVTDDVDFDGSWSLKGAPTVTAKKLVDASLRRAIAALGKEMDAPVGTMLFRDDVDQPLAIERGTVRTASQGHFDAAEIMAGVELAVCAAERLDSLAREREADPPTAAQLIAEQAEVGEGSETFTQWVKSKMSGPVWVLVAILLLANWVTNVSDVGNAANALVLSLDFAAIVLVLLLWKSRGRSRKR